MQKKIYAVRRGRTTGLFLSWADCQKQVDGFPEPLQELHRCDGSLEMAQWRRNDGTEKDRSSQKVPPDGKDRGAVPALAA